MGLHSLCIPQGGGGGGVGGRGYFLKGQNFFHISSLHTEFSDIPPLDQKKREERSSILDVNQKKLSKDLLPT